MKARPRYEPFIDYRDPSLPTRRVDVRTCTLTNTVLLLLMACAVVVFMLLHCVPQDSTAVLFTEPISQQTVVLVKNKSQFNLGNTQAKVLVSTMVKNKQNLKKKQVWGKPVWKKPVKKPKRKGITSNIIIEGERKKAMIPNQRLNKGLTKNVRSNV